MHNVSLTDELHPGTTANKACQNFQEKMNQRLPTYTYGMELFGNGTLRLHTTGTEEYRGQDNVDSILDEVFIRE